MLRATTMVTEAKGGVNARVDACASKWRHASQKRINRMLDQRHINANNTLHRSTDLYPRTLPVDAFSTHGPLPCVRVVRWKCPCPYAHRAVIAQCALSPSKPNIHIVVALLPLTKVRAAAAHLYRPLCAVGGRQPPRAAAPAAHGEEGLAVGLVRGRGRGRSRFRVRVRVPGEG